MTHSSFPSSREVALNRLTQFLPRAGQQYTFGRNTDRGPNHPSAVSRLSPYVRHRLITEQEIIAGVLAQNSLASAEKYVQEVLWRTYWKGWLEMRPAVWSRFLAERDRQRDAFADTRAIADAESGSTGIECFDDWARELVKTGYLHNHVRMWFASIWVFTLGLPWTMGADFFLRHLIDADAASNTLSWRWVVGLQTTGKIYLASTENIARFTDGRFAPTGLAREATAFTEPPIGTATALPEPVAHDACQPSVLLVTHEDMHPESVIPAEAKIDTVIVAADASLLWGDVARQFAKAATADTASRTAVHFGCTTALLDALDAGALIEVVHAAGVRQIVTPYAPVGPVADALARVVPVLANEGITLAQVRRAWDEQFWPHAKKGFFSFNERIPAILRMAT